MTSAASSSRYDRTGPGGFVVPWLAFVALLVFAMIVVGGATRLTDSGLSITEWKPILGAIPPLNDADWQAAFAKYQLIPEYHRVNKGMALEEFKFIFWWEWAHRFLGRIIGLAVAIPLAFFWLRGAIDRPLARKLVGLFALGGLQGAIGWYMVSSGLVDRVDVSQYRLALHLSVAFLILALLVYLICDLVRAGSGAAGVMPQQRRMATFVMLAIFLQVALGALVAGLKAGYAYNTWPDMNGAWIPPGLFEMSPAWLNIFENITMVQFNHRMLAYGVALMVLWHAIPLLGHADSRVCRSAMLLLAAVSAQILLGILTLLYAVPLALGLLHQAGAAITFALAVAHWHLMRTAQS